MLLLEQVQELAAILFLLLFRSEKVALALDGKAILEPNIMQKIKMMSRENLPWSNQSPTGLTARKGMEAEKDVALHLVPFLIRKCQ